MAESDIRLRHVSRRDDATGDRGQAPRQYDDYPVVDLTPYIHAVALQWRSIAGIAVLAAAVSALFSVLVLPKWYRAAAVIRPISTPAVESRIAGMMGGLGGGLGGLGGLAASLGTGASNDAEEYIAILQGFQFSVGLAERHHLSSELAKPGPLSFLVYSKDPSWQIYRRLRKRFDCQYSTKSGNITLYFQARNRKDAERILNYYIDDLHELLRAREVKSASSAIESLEEEARTTPDALLRAVLYDLVAKQVQRKKMAQVEADFAFRVLDAPAASDRAYSPATMLDSIVVSLLVCIVLVIGILFRSRSLNSYSRVHESIGDGLSRDAHWILQTTRYS